MLATIHIGGIVSNAVTTSNFKNPLINVMMLPLRCYGLLYAPFSAHD
jgi:hypothetical protein